MIQIPVTVLISCDNPNCNERFTFASMLKSFNLTPDDVLDMLQEQDVYWQKSSSGKIYCSYYCMEDCEMP